MIKIKNNIPTRETLPQFLVGLKPESLLDLSWTDPALGVQDCAWWPEECQDTPIDTDTHKYGAEILTIDSERKVVVVSHEVVALTQEEIDAARKAITPSFVSMRQARLQLIALNSYDAVNQAIYAMTQTAQAEWEYATEVRRGNPLVVAMTQLLGWLEEDVDNYFIAAEKL